MFWALDDNDIRVRAGTHIPNQDYYCQLCGEKVFYRAGEKKQPHFAHKKGTYCKDSWKYDMSVWHISWKNRFPDEAQEVVITVGEEKHRADVFINGKVIEFQHSSITSEDFKARNKFYTSQGYRVVWVFDVIEEYESGNIAIIDPPKHKYRWRAPKSIFRNNGLPKNAEVYFQFRNDFRDYSLYKITWTEDASFDHFTVSDRFTTKGFVSECLGEPVGEPEHYTFMELWKKEAQDIFRRRHIVYVKNVENENIYMIEKESIQTDDIDTGKCRGYLKGPVSHDFEKESREIPRQETEKKVWILLDGI